MYAENERVGLICSVIANVNRDPKKKPTAYVPSDFVNCGQATDIVTVKKKNDAQKIFDVLKLWCKGGGKK